MSGAGSLIEEVVGGRDAFDVVRKKLTEAKKVSITFTKPEYVLMTQSYSGMGDPLYAVFSSAKGQGSADKDNYHNSYTQNIDAETLYNATSSLEDVMGQLDAGEKKLAKSLIAKMEKASEPHLESVATRRHRRRGVNEFIDDRDAVEAIMLIIRNESKLYQDLMKGTMKPTQAAMEGTKLYLQSLFKTIEDDCKDPSVQKELQRQIANWISAVKAGK